MQEMIRRLDEKKMVSNPYLQPFQPKDFFQWVHAPMQAEPIHDVSVTQGHTEINPIPPHSMHEASMPTENIAAQSNPFTIQPVQTYPSHIQDPKMTLSNGSEASPMPQHNPSTNVNFSNHPLFPPYPMNELQWQHYQENPRPPLNPYPTNPYPSIAKATKQAKAASNHPISNFMTHFKTAEGSYDFPKMMNTAGSMLNSVNQISSIAKSIGALFSGGK